MLLGDGLLALPIALQHRLGHQRQQQAVVLPALLVEQLFLDREVSAHLVESRCQITDLVAGPDGNVDVVVAGADLAGALLESPDRAHRRLGDEHRRYADHENHCGDRDHQVLAEPAQPRERIGVVPRGQDRPVQVGVGDVQRGVGLQLPVAHVVGGGDHARLAALGRAQARGRDGLHQRGAAQVDRAVHDVRRGARVDGVAPVLLRILDENPRVGTHQIVRAGQVGLGGRAHPGGFPVTAGGHDLVDLGGRHRQGHHALDPPVHPDRGHHPCGRGVELRLVGLEVGDPHEVDVVGGQGFLVGLAQLRFAVRAGEDVGPEIGALHDAVDDVALRVEQQRVAVVEAGGDVADVEIEAGVGRRPCAAVPGVLHRQRVGVGRGAAV